MALSPPQHPLLQHAFWVCSFPAPLAESPTPESVLKLLRDPETAPVHSSDGVREKVRALLRHGGFKPSGRSKPASEYLLRTHQNGGLTSINLAVDLCNAVSLASGLPISVVDADKAAGPYHVAIAPSDATYVFNPSGQELDLEGLLCLYDTAGPCGSPVKDSQRTKTDGATVRTACLIWGEVSLAEHVEQTANWYRELLGAVGAILSQGG